MTAIARKIKIEFTQDQLDAQDLMIEAVRKSDDLFTMGGYAGTGKTTVIASAVKNLRGIEKFKNIRIAFCCFTGKASTVLREKLKTAKAIADSDYCGTIHGLIYRATVDDRGRTKWIKVSNLGVALIVIDEASMVGSQIFEDLRSYGVPIVAVGDHGQLPPVSSKFNLMENPMVRLEKIHRQAEKNPIIKVSMMARNGDNIPFGNFTGENGEGVHKSSESYKEKIKSHPASIVDWMILCGMNKTRQEINREARALLNYKGSVRAKEKVICLKNNKLEGIYNGMTGEVVAVAKTNNDDFLNIDVKFDLMGYEWRGDCFAHQFGEDKTLRGYKDYRTKTEYNEMDLRNLFDFGYAITVHKSQGSQAETVLLIEERMKSMSDENWNRWRYTGITRASKNLMIVSQH